MTTKTKRKTRKLKTVTCDRHVPVSLIHSCLRSLVLLGAVALLLPGFAQAQSDDQHKADDQHKDPRKSYALIVGTVWGPDDRPVYGVKVKIRRADQKRAKWELYSNHTGEFAQRLPAGKANYVVWADTKGLKSLTGNKIDPGTEVTVQIESEERMDIGLHLKEVKE
jgi:hypothetical protein